MHYIYFGIPDYLLTIGCLRELFYLFSLKDGLTGNFPYIIHCKVGRWAAMKSDDGIFDRNSVKNFTGQLLLYQ